MELNNGVWQSQNKTAVGCIFHFAYKSNHLFDTVFESPQGEIRTEYPISSEWVEVEVDWPATLTGIPISFGFDTKEAWTNLYVDDIRFIQPPPPPEQFALHGNVGEAGKSVTIKKDNSGEWKTVGTVVSGIGGAYRIPESGFYAISLPEVKEDRYQLIIDEQLWETKFIPEGEWVEEV